MNQTLLATCIRLSLAGSIPTWMLMHPTFRFMQVRS